MNDIIKQINWGHLGAAAKCTVNAKSCGIDSHSGEWNMLYFQLHAKPREFGVEWVAQVS